MRQTLHACALVLTLGTGASLAAEPPAPPPAAPAHHGMHARHHGPPAAQEMTRHMQEDLGLTEEQASRVRAINETHIAQMNRTHEEHDAALKQVLSAEQYAKLRKSREEHEERMGKRHDGPHPH